ncbi:MAG: hypothetical protein KW788_02020 [Candidatus Doudnabacteria bacterium]|nr:hypothetical protein [Candidatus Doudnabacteria bacterium]
MRMIVAVSAPGLPPTPPFGGLEGHLVEVGQVDDTVEAGVVALEKVQAEWDLPTPVMKVTGFRLKSRN